MSHLDSNKGVKMEKTALEKELESRIIKLEEEIKWLRCHIDLLSKLMPQPATPLHPFIQKMIISDIPPIDPLTPITYPSYPNPNVNIAWDTTCDTIYYNSID
jgi:hypothetical protein